MGTSTAVKQEGWKPAEMSSQPGMWKPEAHPLKAPFLHVFGLLIPVCPALITVSGSHYGSVVSFADRAT